MRPIAALLCALAALSATAAGAETRCGWLDNPTPANFWLTDADGEWTLSVQGLGDNGSGFFDADWAAAPTGWWVETNGSYGHGCACIEGTVDPATGWAVIVTEVRPLPLSTCREDAALPSR